MSIPLAVILGIAACGPQDYSLTAVPSSVTYEVAEGGPAPVDAPLPGPALGPWPGDGPWRLVRVADGQEIPMQISGGSAFWIAGPAKATYRLEQGAPKTFPAVECVDEPGKHLTFRTGGRDIVRYNYGVVRAPEGVSETFNRSGYLHPLWTPGGAVLTNDFPKKHLHHHGIWFPWTSSEFKGHPVDFWNSAKKQGRVEFVKMEETFSGPVFAGFRAKQRFVDTTTPDKPEVPLEETWEVRVFAIGDRYAIDLVSTQSAATETPLVIKKYYYGGLGFRGPDAWEAKGAVTFLTSEGRTRADGNETTARWGLVQGRIGGKEGTFLLLNHPSNFRHPQPVRIHPDEPFFCFAPSQGGDFEIAPGKPYVSRFRFVTADGLLKPDEAEALWKAYAQPLYKAFRSN